MKLVIDANELFSSIIGKGKGRETKKLDILFSDKIELYAPFKLLAELEKNKGEIKSKSGFSDIDFEVFLAILKLRIKFVETDKFANKIAEAKGICGDPKDIQYIALAMVLNCAIWSGDKELKNQVRVEVYNTKELIEKFGV